MKWDFALRVNTWKVAVFLWVCDTAAHACTWTELLDFINLQVWTVRVISGPYLFDLMLKTSTGTDVLLDPDVQREPCMDILCLLVNFCQTRCVQSVNLSPECLLSARYTLLKGNGRQAWPLTRANPVNQHSSLAGSPIRSKITVATEAQFERMEWWKQPVCLAWKKPHPKPPPADPARLPIVNGVLPDVSLQMAGYLEYVGKPPRCVFTEYLSS